MQKNERKGWQLTYSVFNIRLVLLQGLRETVHPYTLVSHMGFKEMLESEHAGAKAAPLLHKIVPPLRAALVSRRPGQTLPLVFIYSSFPEQQNCLMKMCVGIFQFHTHWWFLFLVFSVSCQQRSVWEGSDGTDSAEWCCRACPQSSLEESADGR